MADTTMLPTDEFIAPAIGPGSHKPRLSRMQQLNKLYSLPAPLRTFPLPTFVPHNPLSLFHILFAWVSQTISKEQSQIDPLYQGWFSPETRSVHVTNVRAIRGLWEQGFYGKGMLSRSEPSWLNRERTRRGDKAKETSEEVTRKRRADRQLTKWERARKEREAIDLKLQEEAEAVRPREELVHDDVILAPSETLAADAIIDNLLLEDPLLKIHPLPPATFPFVAAPTGPLELLSLPNSIDDSDSLRRTSIDSTVDQYRAGMSNDGFVEVRFYAPPVGPLELLALPNCSCISSAPKHYGTLELGANLQTNRNTSFDGSKNLLATPSDTSIPNGAIPVEIYTAAKFRDVSEDAEALGGSDTNEETFGGSVHSEETTETSEASQNGPSPSSEKLNTPKIKHQKSVRFSPTVEKTTFIQSEPPSPDRSVAPIAVVQEEPLAIKNQEHLQLSLEEAFFLSYGLGALTVLDAETRSPLSNDDLFYLCRKTSYFPPQTRPSLAPDDPFMINYVVYHHFRSLGWVVRSGIKFSVDFMLYNRGPVFTHAEFAIILLPSYSDPYWRSDPFLEHYSKDKEKRTWAWMSCINRVINQVKKTLVLAYVDIPTPLNALDEQRLGIDGVLARYKVREVVMRRFSANRMRD